MTTDLLAFDAEMRHAVACEDEFQAYFTARRVRLPDTWLVHSLRKHLWKEAYTGCTNGSEAARAIKEETVHDEQRDRAPCKAYELREELKRERQAAEAEPEPEPEY